MFSTPAFVPLDHDACVTPVVRGCTPKMERPRPPAHPGARSHDHGLHARTTTTTTTSSALDEWHTPAPAQKTVAETTPGYVVYRAIPLHDGRAPKPKQAPKPKPEGKDSKPAPKPVPKPVAEAPAGALEQRPPRARRRRGGGGGNGGEGGGAAA